MSGQRTSILIVDDSEELRYFYALILQARGYEVRTASSGEEALELIRQARPDALIVDVVMPGMDGFELLTRLRSDLAPPLPPAIVCSGFAVTAEEALRRGALGFLPKPIDPDDLAKSLETVLRGRAPEAPLAEEARRHAEASRASARLLTESALTASALRLADDRTTPYFDWLARYFAVSIAAAIVATDGRLEVLSANRSASISRGDTVTVTFGPCVDVIETGDVLVVRDLITHVSFSSSKAARVGMRAFAGVPLRDGAGIPLGALCLADKAPRRWTAEDSYALSALGRRGSEFLQEIVRDESPLDALAKAPPIRTSVFNALLEMEARTLHTSGGALEVMIAQLEDAAKIGNCSEAIAKRSNTERIAVGSSGDRLLVFKRAPDELTANVAVGEILQIVQETAKLQGAARVVVVGSAPWIQGAELLRIADQVMLGDPGKMERVFISRDQPAAA